MKKSYFIYIFNKINLLTNFTIALMVFFLLNSCLKSSDIKEDIADNKNLSFINYIPEDVITFTLSYLDSTDLFSCEIVSHKFYKIIQNIWVQEDKKITLKDVTPKKIESFIKDQRPFKSLNISRNKLEKLGFGLENLNSKKTLKYLDISGNILYPLQLVGLSNLTNLTNLKINRVIMFDTGDSLSFLSNLTNLTSLELNSNNLAPNSLQYITKLTSLKNLDISNNLSLELSDYLKSLKCLESFNFNKTNIKKDDIQKFPFYKKI